jgi:integrase
MGVYERADSRCWWMWLEGTNPPIRTSTKVPLGAKHARKDSRDQAEEIYRAAMGDVARGTFKLPTAKASRTFRQQAEWYRDNVTVHHRGAARERSTLNNLIAHFGDLPLASITTASVEAWKLQRAKVVKQSTVNRELEVLKPVLSSAVPHVIDSNPAATVKKFRLRFPQITILTEHAEDALLKVATPAERAFLLLGLDALLRSGDARRLRVEHDKGGYLEIVDPKTEAYKVPVSKRLRAALDALRPVEGFYFPRKYAKTWRAMNSITAFALFRGVCDRANVPAGRAGGGVTFHALRHTGATRAARSVKLTVVQRLGGWKSLTQLARYDHPDDPEIIRAVEAIGARERDVSGTKQQAASRRLKVARRARG